MCERSFSLPPNAGSVRFSREAIRDALAEFDEDAVEAAAILTDELVTNAIMHGKPPIVLDINEDHGTVTVTVKDAGSGVPVSRLAQRDALSGRGLTIVDSMSDGWGVDVRQHGKCVWFQLNLQPVALRHVD
jgi:anti-sigma regulatory factor (Ser/Thr protein kinase)